MVVSTSLPSPQSLEMLNQLYAYIIGLNLRIQCEGCDKNYMSQRDHSCLMEWEEKVETRFEEEFEKVEVFPIYEA